MSRPDAEPVVANRSYRTSGREKRWTTDNAGNAAIEGERNRAILAAVDAGRPDARVLEVGCGRGGVLGTLDTHQGPAFGVDLDPERLRIARQAGCVVLRADAVALPARSAAVDVIVLANVLSSVREGSARHAIARECARVLHPEGLVLWYDQRWPNPTNRNTAPVTERGLGDLFPDWAIDVAPATVLPLLARRWPDAYDRLGRLRVLHTHLLGVLRPPTASERRE